MSWSGEHLHRFVIHGAEYGISYVDGPGFRDDARESSGSETPDTKSRNVSRTSRMLKNSTSSFAPKWPSRNNEKRSYVGLAETRPAAVQTDGRCSS